MTVLAVFYVLFHGIIALDFHKCMTLKVPLVFLEQFCLVIRLETMQFCFHKYQYAI